MEKKIDDVSLKILSIMQKNSRESFSEIGRKVGLSAPAVAERIKKMETEGVINNYTVNISHEKLGLKMMAFVLINLPGSTLSQVDKTENAIEKIPEVIECHRVTGHEDMVIKLIFEDIHHLNKLINAVAPYGQVNTCIVVNSLRDQACIDIETLLTSKKEK